MARTLAAIAAFALLLPAGAVAHDHAAPSVFLRSGEARQRGLPVSYCWNSPPADDGTRSILCSDTLGAFPEADPATVSHRARVRFRDADRPARVRIKGWQELDEDGNPPGPATIFTRKLRALRRDGKIVAWDAIFTLPSRPGDLYLQARGDYRKDDGSGAVVLWRFHLMLE